MTSGSIELPRVTGDDDSLRDTAAQPLLARGDTISALLGQPVPTHRHSGNKLGTILGVYIPTILNQMGVVFFLRWGYIVGQYGILLFLGMFVVSDFCAFFTIMSLSAIVTNGRVRGGGCYFMISRALGPEFGAAIGLVFWVANIVSGAQCTFGFGEAVVDIYLPHAPISRFWLQLVLNSGALLIIMIVAMAGAEWFSKTGVFLVVVLTAVVLFLFFTFLVAPVNPEVGFYGPGSGLINTNLLPNITDVIGTDGELKSDNFVSVFGVLFPAVTGIMTGANLSGDLKDPGRSVPVGTLTAAITCGIVNIVFALLLGGTITRMALKTDDNIMAHVWEGAKIPWFIGVLISSLANSLESVLGASRVLQALARDNLLPLRWMAHGSGPGDEPRRALVATWLLMQACLFVPTLNLLSTYSSMFLLQAWAFVNIACLVLSVTGTHNWRPSFKLFSWHTALAGSLMCAAAMFLTDYMAALISMGIVLILFGYVHWFRKPQTSWGDVMQAIMYHQVRKYLLRLDSKKDHIKYWRPQVLLCSNNPSRDNGLLQVCHGLKKGGLFVTGTVVVNTDIKSAFYECSQVQQAWERIIEAANLKAFTEVTRAPDVRTGLQSLFMMAGLGNMRPNIVVMGWSDCSTKRPQPPPLIRSHSTLKPTVNSALRYFPSLPSLNPPAMTAEEYVGVMRDVLLMGKSIILGRGFDKFTLTPSVPGTIDVWPLQRMGDTNATLSTALLLADGLRRTHGWNKKTRLRVLASVDDHGSIEQARSHLVNILARYRINATPVIVVASESSLYRTQLDEGYAPPLYRQPTLPQFDDDEETGDTTLLPLAATAPMLARHSVSEQAAVLNDLIKIHSAEANVVFVGMRVPDGASGPQADTEFITFNRLLTQDLPPVLLVNGVSTVITEVQ